MTTAAAELCGHRWADPSPILIRHRCTATHADPCPCPTGTCTVHCTQPPVHRCRCGATTTRSPQ